MNEKSTKIKRALISVSNKEGIVEFASELVSLGVELVSTGGTCQLLQENNLPVQDVSSVTKFPEIMNGRVKTLHPKIHGGILGLRDEHVSVANENGIEWFDLVVCNLYPFAETIKKVNVMFDDAIENIDIGGPSMLRAAAKNMGWVTVLVDVNDYQPTIDQLKIAKEIPYALRKHYAIKAFQHTAHYDAIISEYLQSVRQKECPEIAEENIALSGDADFPQEMSLGFEKYLSLRYGENPHQKACVYKSTQDQSVNILNAKIKQGKPLSYNNIADAEAALNCLCEFQNPACVIVKHANPCGVASADNLINAYDQAFEADSKSAFGGIVALNKAVTKELAEKLVNIFFEIVIAPEFSEEALSVLVQKPNLRVLALGGMPANTRYLRYQSIRGGLLVQESDHHIITKGHLKQMTKASPTPIQEQAMLFAWKVLKHVKSNGIVVAHHQVTLGIGAGQVSRIDAVNIAIQKTPKELLANAVLASDAFFPFRDSIDKIAAAGIKAIIQPGGSVKDKEVIEACDEHGIVMVFTSTRCFNH